MKGGEGSRRIWLAVEVAAIIAAALAFVGLVRSRDEEFFLCSIFRPLAEHYLIACLVPLFFGKFAERRNIIIYRSEGLYPLRIIGTSRSLRINSKFPS